MTIVVRNARLMTCDPARPGPLGVIDHGAFVVDGGTIRWLGEDGQTPASGKAVRVVDVGGALVTPGLIDCHTHAIFAGSRANEFAMRAAGTPYDAIHHAYRWQGFSHERRDDGH